MVPSLEQSAQNLLSGILESESIWSLMASSLQCPEVGVGGPDTAAGMR